MSGDALSGHIAPDANISLWDAYSTRPGDIVLNDHIESRLDSAVLGTTILRYSDRYVRYITDKEGVDIGTLNIERPVPDPGTLFSDLAQDSLLAGVPTGLRSEVDPESLVPSPTEACGSRITKCSVIVPSADVFYFGPDPTNTACLASITSEPPTPTPPQISMDPSSVYVVYQPAQIFDDCRNWVGGVAGPPVTMSYPSGVLSTLEYQSNAPPATKSLNTADLPCPPSNVAQVYDPRVPYSPILISELGVKFNPYFIPNDSNSVNPVMSGEICAVAAVRDPPVHANRVGKITGPKDGGGPIPMIQRV